MKLAVNYLIDNCYFTLGSMCFRQLIELPMGSYPTLFMAKLFLYYCEKKCLLLTKKRDLRNARTFSNIFRFIDDLYTFNDNKFENNYKDIYPDDIEIQKENENPCIAWILDLLAEVRDRKFTIELFNETDTFPIISIACPIWIAIYHLKHFMLRLVLIFSLLPGQQQI